MSGLPVVPPDMVPGLAFIAEIANLSTTRVKVDLTTTPATSVTLQLMNLGSATAKRVFVVANAMSDAEASTKLATAGQRFTCAIGDSLTLAFAEAVSRIDIVSDVAETGSSCAVVTAIGG